MLNERMLITGDGVCLGRMITARKASGPRMGPDLSSAGESIYARSPAQTDNGRKRHRACFVVDRHAPRRALAEWRTPVNEIDCATMANKATRDGCKAQNSCPRSGVRTKLRLPLCLLVVTEG